MTKLEKVQAAHNHQREYWWGRFDFAYKKGRFDKAAYFKARYEIFTNSYLSSGTDEEMKYQDFSKLDHYADYDATIEKYSN